nr:unnamed protein product [Spirometra erinaceieuropaei]
MGLFGHMRIHESGIDHNLDTPSSNYTPPLSTPTTISPTILSASCTPTMPSLTNTPPPSTPNTSSSSSTANISETDNDTADFSCAHCPCTFTSHIGLAGHLRIHRTETGQPMLGTSTYIA